MAFSLQLSEAKNARPIEHNHQGKLVLVVEDDADLRSLLCDVVRELELQVTEATDGNGAIRKIMDGEPHIVLSGLWIPGGGFEYVKTVRALYPSCPVILLAALGDHRAKAEAIACGVKAYFTKPVSLKDLRRAIIEILDDESEPAG